MDKEKTIIKNDLKIVFMGTPVFSVPVLEGLINNYQVVAVVTQPDRCVGRKKQLVSSPIKQVANKNHILVLQPERIKEHIQQIIDLEPDLIITCAYGQILPNEILNCPKIACINVHASLLPKLRGGAPIHHAIIDGYKETGITIMHMSQKMDAGDIISSKKIEILDTDTVETLHDKLSMMASELLLETLPSIINGTAIRTPQNESDVTYGFNITREDEQINFDKSKREIFNQIRGLNSWPGAFTKLDGKIMKVWSSYETNHTFSNLLNGTITNIYSDGIGVKVNDGEIVFTEIQPEGKTKMSVSSFINGIQDKNNLIGKKFG